MAEISSAPSTPAGAPAAPSNSAPSAPAAPRAPSNQTGLPAPRGDASPLDSAPRKVSPPGEPARYRAVVNGKEVFLSGEQLARDYQLAEASRQKMEEAARSRKQVDAVLRKFKEDPYSAIEELLRHEMIGHDPDKVVTEMLIKQMERKALTPEQRELLETREKLSKYERQEQERAERERTEREQRLIQQEVERIEQEAIQAIQGSDLPQDARSFERVMKYVALAHRRGRTDVGPADVIERVRQDYEKELQHFVGRYDADRLAGLLGDDNLGKLQQRAVQQFRQAPADPPAAPAAPRPRREAADNSPKTIQQVLEDIRKGRA